MQGVLIAALPSALVGCSAEERASDRQVQHFQHDYESYGYKKYLMSLEDGAKKASFSVGSAPSPMPMRSDRSLTFLEAFSLRNLQSAKLESVRVSQTRTLDGIEIERLEFDLTCGAPVISLIGKPLLPGAAKGLVLLLHGMGTTPERSMGIGEQDYMLHLGRRLVESGFYVVCPFIPQAGNFVSMSVLAVLLASAGLDFHSLLVSMAISSLEVALKRIPSTVERVGCYGVSIGALIGLHCAIVEQRLTGLVMSGYLRDDLNLISTGVIEKAVRAGEIYPTWFRPETWQFGLINTVRLLCPRPLFFEVGTDDEMSSSRMGRDETLRGIVALYDQTNKSRNLQYTVFEGGHEANGVAAIHWLERIMREQPGYA